MPTASRVSCFQVVSSVRYRECDGVCEEYVVGSEVGEIRENRNGAGTWKHP